MWLAERPPSVARRRGPTVPDLRRNLVVALVILCYVVAVEALIGWRTLLLRALTAGAPPVLLVLLALGVSYLLRSLRLRAALPASADARLFDVIRVFAVHNAANWLLPARLGELSLPLQLHRHFGVSLARGSGLLLRLRLQDLHVLGTLGGLVLLGFGHDRWRWIGVSVALLGLLLPLLISQLAPSLARRWPHLQHLLTAAAPDAPAAARDLALSWLAWGGKLLGVGTALTLILPLPVAAGVLGALGGDVAAILPVHAPLGAGTYEAGVLLGLLPWSPDWVPAVSAAVQVHALLLGVALIAGALGLSLRPPVASPETAA